MPVQVGEAAGQYNTISHIVNGEPASQTVFRRPSINLQNRTDALKTFANALETRYISHDHTGNSVDEPGQLTRAALSDINVNNGICGLDGNGKVPVAQLPGTVLGDVKYQGTWDADANSPSIATGSASSDPNTGNQGWYYVVSNAGATDVDGITDWKVGDWIISNGTTWEKVDNTTEPRLQEIVDLSLTGKGGWTLGVNGLGTGLELIDTPTQNAAFQTELDSHDNSITLLQSQVNSVITSLNDILSNVPKEQRFTVGVGGQALFTLTDFAFDSTHTNIDIQVFVNTDRVFQSTTGALDTDFRKVGTTQIEFSYTVPEGAIVTVFKTGTSSGGSVGDFSNVTVNLEPILDTLTLGTSTRPWQSLFIKDKTSNQVYELEVVGGVFQVTLV